MGIENTVNSKLIQAGATNKYAVFSSIFRVFACLLIAKQVLSIWLYAQLLYGSHSYIVPAANLFSTYTDYLLFPIRNYIYSFLAMFIGLLLMYALGIGKRYTAFAVFICFDLLQRACPEILNGGDNLLKFILLYMVFIDSYKYLSLNPLSYKHHSSIYYSNILSNIFGLSICIHLVMVYAISAIDKVHSDVWYHGLATYYTFQLERFRGTPINNILARSPFFVTITTYFTLAVELTYPTLVWFKQTRKSIVICMILLHIGIYVFMMIYDFQYVFIMTQGFFFSNEAWKGVAEHIKIFPSQIFKVKISNGKVERVI